MGLKDFLRKSEKTGPGSHGSHKWYINRLGEVVYGQAPQPRRLQHGEKVPLEEIPHGTEEHPFAGPHHIRQGKYGRYLIVPGRHRPNVDYKGRPYPDHSEYATSRHPTRLDDTIEVHFLGGDEPRLVGFYGNEVHEGPLHDKPYTNVITVIDAALNKPGSHFTEEEIRDSFRHRQREDNKLRRKYKEDIPEETWDEASKMIGQAKFDWPGYMHHKPSVQEAEDALIAEHERHLDEHMKRALGGDVEKSFRGYLMKSQATGPGAHGSHKWYVNRNGIVIYGDRPQPHERRKVGTMTMQEIAPWEDNRQAGHAPHHIWIDGKHGRYLVTPNDLTSYGNHVEVYHEGQERMYPLGEVAHMPTASSVPGQTHDYYLTAHHARALAGHGNGHLAILPDGSEEWDPHTPNMERLTRTKNADPRRQDGFYTYHEPDQEELHPSLMHAIESLMERHEAELDAHYAGLLNPDSEADPKDTYARPDDDDLPYVGKSFRRVLNTLRKSKGFKHPVYAPGSHGSHRWFIDWTGQVVYGDEPKRDQHHPGDAHPAYEFLVRPDNSAFSETPYHWYHGRFGRYLVPRNGFLTSSLGGEVHAEEPSYDPYIRHFMGDSHAVVGSVGYYPRGMTEDERLADTLPFRVRWRKGATYKNADKEPATQDWDHDVVEHVDSLGEAYKWLMEQHDQEIEDKMREAGLLKSFHIPNKRPGHYGPGSRGGHPTWNPHLNHGEGDWDYSTTEDDARSSPHMTHYYSWGSAQTFGRKDVQPEQHAHGDIWEAKEFWPGSHVWIQGKHGRYLYQVDTSHVYAPVTEPRDHPRGEGGVVFHMGDQARSVGTILRKKGGKHTGYANVHAWTWNRPDADRPSAYLGNTYNEADDTLRHSRDEAGLAKWLADHSDAQIDELHRRLQDPGHDPDFHKSQAEGPGSHGSYKWYIDQFGKVVYGEKPALDRTGYPRKNFNYEYREMPELPNHLRIGGKYGYYIVTKPNTTWQRREVYHETEAGTAPVGMIQETGDGQGHWSSYGWHHRSIAGHGQHPDERQVGSMRHLIKKDPSGTGPGGDSHDWDHYLTNHNNYVDALIDLIKDHDWHLDQHMKGLLGGGDVQKSHAQGPGSRGSHKWYVNRLGEVVYGEKPLHPGREPREVGDVWDAEGGPEGHKWYKGKVGTYLFTPTGDVLRHGEGAHMTLTPKGRHAPEPPPAYLRQAYREAYNEDRFLGSEDLIHVGAGFRHGDWVAKPEGFTPEEREKYVGIGWNIRRMTGRRPSLASGEHLGYPPDQEGDDLLAAQKWVAGIHDLDLERLVWDAMQPPQNDDDLDKSMALSKSRKTGAGSHGSTHWYVNGEGQVVYGDKPLMRHEGRPMRPRRQGEECSITLGGQQVRARFLGKGHYSWAARPYDHKGILSDHVFLFTKGDDMKELLLHVQDRSPHIPEIAHVETQDDPRDPQGVIEVYRMPVYDKLTKEHTQAWADAKLLQKCFEEAFKTVVMQRPNVMKRDPEEGYHRATEIIALAKKYKVRRSLINALDLMATWMASYGSGVTFEFPTRNLSVDKRGRLVLRDCLFDAERLRNERLQKQVGKGGPSLPWH